MNLLEKIIILPLYIDSSLLKTTGYYERTLISEIKLDFIVVFSLIFSDVSVI